MPMEFAQKDLLRSDQLFLCLFQPMQRTNSLIIMQNWSQVFENNENNEELR